MVQRSGSASFLIWIMHFFAFDLYIFWMSANALMCLCLPGVLLAFLERPWAAPCRRCCHAAVAVLEVVAL